MKSKVFGLFMALMLLLSGNSFAQSLPLLLTDDSFWNGDFDNFYYSDGSSSLEVCDPNNPVNGCVKEAKQSTGSFLADGDVEIRKLVQPTAETGVFDVSIGVRGNEVVSNEPICAVVVFDRSSTMAGGKFTNARIGAVELLNLLHSQNPENYLGFVSFHLSADAEIQLEKRSAELAFSTGEIRDWSSNDEGTNIHWGLVEARNQLMGQEGCDDLRKFVILISDGEPNSYHTLSGDECYTNNGTGAGWGGSDYPVCIDLISGDPFAAKYATGAAALLKANNYSTIYSIGYGAETKGKAILREIASDSSYYRDGNSSSIIQIFNSIAGDITSDKVEVGTNAQIVDTLNQVTLKSGNNTKTFAKITEGWQIFNFQVSLNPSVGADWYKTNNGLRLSYTDAYDQHQTLTIAPNDTAEIYWEVPVESVTVTFDPNGGTPTPDPETVDSGDTVDEPDDPILTGYHLTGWTRTCDETDFFNFATDVVTEDITLCAKWEPNTYQVKFDKNGGEGTMGNQTFTYNVSGNLNQNSYTKQGAIFNGWNTKQGGNGTSYNDKQEVKNLATTGTVTLYAQWLDNEVTVTFDPNGGTPTPDPETVDSGDTVDEPDDPILTGYHLTGWTRTCDGTDFFNFATDVVTEDITLCAKWEPNTYQVKFDKNGGEGTMGNQTFTYNVSGNLNQNSYTKQGAIFNGWNTKQGGNGTSYNDKQEVKNLATTGTVTLYAQWLDNEVTVTFDPNGGTPTPDPETVDSGDTVDEPDDPILTGYHLTGWTRTCDGTDFFNFATDVVTEDITLCAKWEPNNYQIKFNGNGGNGTMPNQTLTYGTPENLNSNTFAKEGSTFVGWNTKADNSGTPYADQEQVLNLATSGVVNLYAQWSTNSYEIAFDKNTGNGTMTNQTLSYGTTGTLKANAFTKTGYHFTRWNTKADGTGTPYQDRAQVRNLATTGVVRLYAQWSPNTYTIVYSGNGSTSGDMLNQSLTYDTTGSLNPNDFGKKGYKFKGWNTKPDGTGTPYQDKAQVRNLATTGEVMLYAQWEPNKYTIIFDGNGAKSGVMSGLEVEYDKDVTLTKNAYKKGSSSFLGWNTRADGKGTAYADEQSVRNLATEGEIVLYAQWKSGGSSGGGGSSSSYACKNLPSNVEINNSLKPSGKDVDYYYSTDVSKPCTFQCKVGYVRNEKTEKCEVPEKDKPKDPDPVLPKKCSIEGSTHSAEVNEAYIWACERGIIKSDTIQGARLGEFLNRAEMAKITTIFEMLEVGTMPDRTKDCSAFEASMSGYNSEMKNYMVTSCQLLRMGIHTADYTPIPDFMPRKFVSRAEFGTILSRILWGDKYEAEKNSRYYYVDHLYKLRDEGILTNIDPTLVERRSYAILMIYRAAKMLGKI